MHKHTDTHTATCACSYTPALQSACALAFVSKQVDTTCNTPVKQVYRNRHMWQCACQCQVLAVSSACQVLAHLLLYQSKFTRALPQRWKREQTHVASSPRLQAHPSHTPHLACVCMPQDTRTRLHASRYEDAPRDTAPGVLLDVGDKGLRGLGLGPPSQPRCIQCDY